MKELNLYIILVNGVGQELFQSEKYISEAKVKQEYLNTHAPWIDPDEVEVKSIDVDRLARLLF